MKLDLTDMLYALSFALDKVETQLLGLDTGHSRHVTYMSMLMGKEAGFSPEELRDFAGCCILHDNALTEFIHEELVQNKYISVNVSDMIVGKDNMGINYSHSTIGEKNVRLLPFRTDIKDIVLYHHENADGSGAMHKTAAETPLKSQILHLADVVDMKCRLMNINNVDFKDLCDWVQSKTGSLFSEEAAKLFIKAVDYDRIVYFQLHGAYDFLQKELHNEIIDYSDSEIHNIAEMFAKIIDYKSEFTQAHSKGVADKAELMAKYYGFDPEKTIRFYFAGAMHDIGKLAISNNILEKPGKLTTDEFSEMKNHAAATYHILSQIKEIPDIVEWASNHHEKLNGKGYPRGLSAEELSFEDQLMACIDIYQALTEKRPYKDGMSHEKTVSILREMADKGELNEKIVQDMDIVMAEQGAEKAASPQA